MTIEAIDPEQEASAFIRLAISKNTAMQQELESFFTVRIGPQQIAQIRAASEEAISLNPEKASVKQLCVGLVDAVEKCIEIQLELASAITSLKGRPAHELGHREPEPHTS